MQKFSVWKCLFGIKLLRRTVFLTQNLVIYLRKLLQIFATRSNVRIFAVNCVSPTINCVVQNALSLLFISNYTNLKLFFFCMKSENGSVCLSQKPCQLLENIGFFTVKVLAVSIEACSKVTC